MSTSRTAAVSAAFAAALLAQRSYADTNDAGITTDLSAVVVSATRTAQPLEKTGSSISIISAEQLEAEQTVILSDALAQLPGLALSRNGGPGQTTGLYIRGADPGKSVLLIDGVRFNDPGAPDEAASLSDLLVNDIDHVEVLRGPQSTLYGSDAIGGVVNLLTRRGGPDAERLQAEGGSFDTYRLNAAATGTAGPLEYGGAVNYFDTQGISAADSLRGNSEPDGDRNLSATLNARFNASDTLSFDARGLYLRSRTDTDGYPPPDYAFQDDAEFDRYALRAGYAAANLSTFDGAWTHRVALIGSHSDRRLYGQFDPVTNAFSPAENFYSDGGATRWEYQGVIKLGMGNEFTYGAETERSTLDTGSLPSYGAAPTTGSDRLTGYYSQLQAALGSQLTFTAGTRRDHDANFGDHSSGKLALAWQPTASTVLRGNFTSGFKAPTLYQLYSQYQNPSQTLAPDTARGGELGIDQRLGSAVRVSATYFERTEHNEIGFFDCYATPGDAGCAAQIMNLGFSPGGYYYNVGRTSSRGLETDVTAQLAPTLSAWANYSNSRNLDERTGRELQRRPHISANGGVTWQASSAASIGASLSYVGARYDDGANSVPLLPETIFNLYGSYDLTQRLQLFGRIENLFKDRKEPVYGYGQAGRALYAGVRVTL